ncbi:hypothetical protein HNY73_001950 [Argiope bruennichi]|uniref:Uncharacterized protein n=1 Tax=Argiope bruennichi TaxID=94029 RepID=A0A8T0FS60_ARGBR|nr:hypothetical protein HNY73_001950 [Argiope bruennichi]
MVYRSFSVAELMSLAVVVGLVFIWSSGSDGQVYGNYSLKHDNISLRREKRRTQPQNGFFFPIAMYTVRHHRPPNDRGRAVRPETWEYRGQYFYGFRPRPNSGRRRAARLLAAGLPLLLAPLLSILFSFPVVIPVAQMTAVTTGATFPGHYGRRRRRKRSEPPPYSQEKAARLKELEVVTDYLHQGKTLSCKVAYKIPPLHAISNKGCHNGRTSRNIQCLEGKEWTKSVSVHCHFFGLVCLIRPSFFNLYVSEFHAFYYSETLAIFQKLEMSQRCKAH